MAGVLVLDDGELEDIQHILEEIGAAFARVRGGAIVDGTQPPTDLLITTPRRMGCVEPTSHDEKGPIRIVVTSEDSNALRTQLRSIGFDYLVRRPVHPEALRLLLLRCLYKGDERRQSIRVAVGSEVSFRAGILTRRATLVDLSQSGCRLLSRTPVEPGKRLRVQIPEALDTGEPFTLTGRVVRATPELGLDDEVIYHVGLHFDRTTDDAQAALAAVIEGRAAGPATLRPSEPLAHAAGALQPPPEQSPLIEPPLAPPPAARLREPLLEIPRGRALPELEVDVGLEPDLGEERRGSVRSSDPSAVEADAHTPEHLAVAEEVAPETLADRRSGSRVDYKQTVPAFGKRALRVLVGRDLSMGGMRIEPLPGLELGDRLHLAIYGDPGEAPFLIWATVCRDDGYAGLGLVFDSVDESIASRLESIVGNLPSVEDLRDQETEALGTVMSEILDR